MNIQDFSSKPDLKMEHLWTQRDHLSIVGEYHLWMMNHTSNLAIKESHRAVAERIFEARAQLDLLISALGPSLAAGPGLLPSVPLEAKMNQ